ncbi:protein FLX-like 3 [Carex littledalei]|uniref:Protein FLX-like 3 n=1 Tax=Carex littledalei TaxID=544730 RepID=A0A833QKN0_9POAL|nr:protein FLX-like 3 [Carex littledalei]
MSRRNRTSRQQEMRGFRDDHYLHPLPRGGGGGPVPVPAYPIEEEIAMRREEFRRIHSDNRRMLDDISFLKRENDLVLKKRRFISEQSVPQLRAEKESVSREWIQKVLKLEGELRSLEPVKSDVMHLQAELRRAESSADEISAKIKELMGEFKRLQAENEKIADIKAEIEARRQELARARAAREYEKKVGAELEEQVQVMQQSLVGMARESEQLRAELMRRVRGPDYGAYGPPRMEMGISEMYGMNYGPDGDYGGGPRPSPYDPPGRLPLP